MDRRYLVTCPWVSGEESQVANRRQIILPTPFPHMWPANDGTQAALNAGTAKMNLDPIPMPPTAQPPSAAHGPFVRGFRQRRGEALPIAGEAAFCVETDMAISNARVTGFKPPADSRCEVCSEGRLLGCKYKEPYSLFHPRE
jgi:hypothetical protein